MSLEKTLEALDEKYYDDPDAQREATIETLTELHEQSLMEGMEGFRSFAKETMSHCGGVYIPFIMWTELANYIEDPENRTHIFDIIAAFVNSDFELPERKRMKSLLITYFAMEREFEVNKVMTLIVEKAHQEVQEFFRKVQNFVSKNKTSVGMYVDKFNMLKEYAPNFDLLRMPVSKLKEHLEEAE